MVRQDRYSRLTNVVSPYLRAETRTLEQAQATIQRKFDKLPLNHKDRPELARMIRQLDDEILARERL